MRDASPGRSVRAFVLVGLLLGAGMLSFAPRATAGSSNPTSAPDVILDAGQMAHASFRSMYFEVAAPVLGSLAFGQVVDLTFQNVSTSQSYAFLYSPGGNVISGGVASFYADADHPGTLALTFPGVTMPSAGVHELRGGGDNSLIARTYAAPQSISFFVGPTPVLCYPGGSSWSYTVSDASGGVGGAQIFGAGVPTGSFTQSDGTLTISGDCPTLGTHEHQAFVQRSNETSFGSNIPEFFAKVQVEFVQGFAPLFSIADLQAPASSPVGQSVSVSAVVRNDGNAEGTANVRLMVNQAQREVQTASLVPDESRVLSFSFTPTVAGTYSVAIGVGTKLVGPVSLVVEAPSLHLDDLEVPALTLVSEPVVVSATVRNEGGASGSGAVALLVNDVQRDSLVVELGPGEMQGISFSFTPTVAGIYAVSLRMGSVDLGPLWIEVIQPSFELEEIDAPARSQVGVPFETSVRVKNTGPLAASTLVALTINGAGVASVWVLIAAGESVELPFSHTPLAIGPHEIIAELGSSRIARTVQVYAPATLRLAEAEASPLFAGSQDLTIENATAFESLTVELSYDPTRISFAAWKPGDAAVGAVSVVDDRDQGRLTLVIVATGEPVSGGMRLLAISWTAKRLDTESTPVEPASAIYHQDGRELPLIRHGATVHTSMLGTAPNAVLRPISDALASGR